MLVSTFASIFTDGPRPPPHTDADPIDADDSDPATRAIGVLARADRADLNAAIEADTFFLPRLPDAPRRAHPDTDAAAIPPERAAHDTTTVAGADAVAASSAMDDVDIDDIDDDPNSVAPSTSRRHVRVRVRLHRSALPRLRFRRTRRGVRARSPSAAAIVARRLQRRLRRRRGGDDNFTADADADTNAAEVPPRRRAVRRRAAIEVARASRPRTDAVERGPTASVGGVRDEPGLRRDSAAASASEPDTAVVARAHTRANARTRAMPTVAAAWQHLRSLTA